MRWPLGERIRGGTRRPGVRLPEMRSLCLSSWCPPTADCPDRSHSAQQMSICPQTSAAGGGRGAPRSSPQNPPRPDEPQRSCQAQRPSPPACSPSGAPVCPRPKPRAGHAVRPHPRTAWYAFLLTGAFPPPAPTLCPTRTPPPPPPAPNLIALPLLSFRPPTRPAPSWLPASVRPQCPLQGPWPPPGPPVPLQSAPWSWTLGPPGPITGASSRPPSG